MFKRKAKDKTAKQIAKEKDWAMTAHAMMNGAPYLEDEIKARLNLPQSWFEASVATHPRYFIVFSTLIILSLLAWNIERISNRKHARMKISILVKKVEHLEKKVKYTNYQEVRNMIQTLTRDTKQDMHNLKERLDHHESPPKEKR